MLYLIPEMRDSSSDVSHVYFASYKKGQTKNLNRSLWFQVPVPHHSAPFWPDRKLPFWASAALSWMQGAGEGAPDPGQVGEKWAKGERRRSNRRTLTVETEQCVSEPLGTILPLKGQEINSSHTAAPWASLCFLQASTPLENLPLFLTGEPFVFTRLSLRQAPATNPGQLLCLLCFFSPLLSYISYKIHFRLVYDFSFY